MSDNGQQETRIDTLKRVLAPLTGRNDKRFVLAVSITCFFAEFPIFMFSFMMFFYLAAVLLLPFDFVSDFSENLIIYVSLIFLIAVPHIIANIIAVSLKKKDILIELLIALSVTAIFAMIVEYQDKKPSLIGLPKFFFTKAYLLTILCVILADAIFYAVAFKRERAKAKGLLD